MKAPRWDGLACEVGPMARMFVSGLFTNASSLATTVAISGLAGYAAYVKGGAAATGLDPAMIKADIAVALVQVGLATLVSGASATVMVGNGAALPTAASATVQAYSGTGAFAGYDTVIKGPIFDWIYNLKAGYSTMDRLRGRALESLVIIQGILGSYTKTGSWAANGNRTNSWHDDGWLSQLRGAALGSQTFKDKGIRSGTWQGWGATEAPRGALMHQCTITDGKITKYQCIVPTTWNGSPVSNSGGTDHGAIEQAVIGAPFATTTWNADGQGGAGTITGVHGGVEVLRIAQSFDPCIACAIH
jgi:Ni,Fe-hydrogenase I large subunit